MGTGAMSWSSLQTELEPPHFSEAGDVPEATPPETADKAEATPCPDSRLPPCPGCVEQIPDRSVS